MMDGDSLVTLIGLVPGPDGLKDLVPKVGLRLKLYKQIKLLYNFDVVSTCTFICGYEVYALNNSLDKSRRLNTC